MLIKRLVSSVIIIIVVVFAVKWLWLCGLAVILLSIGGLYEFFTMVERKGTSIYKYFGIGMGAIIPLSVLLQFQLTKSWEFFFIVIAMLALILMQFRRRDNQGVIISISVTMFGILYIAWFLSFLIKLRLLANGVGLLAALLIITKLGDIGAYLVGSRFGKTPLMPRISPKKSVEGAIGGLAFSVFGSWACNIFIPYFSYLHLTLIGIILGVLGQLGDLSESLIKRDCQLKDSGNLFPGMGGVLDLVDSLLFTAPVFYFYTYTLIK